MIVQGEFIYLVANDNLLHLVPNSPEYRPDILSVLILTDIDKFTPDMLVSFQKSGKMHDIYHTISNNLSYLIDNTKNKSMSILGNFAKVFNPSNKVS